MIDATQAGIENGSFGPYRLKVSVFLGRPHGSHTLIATHYVTSANRIDSFVLPDRFLLVEQDALPLQPSIPESF